MLTVLHQRSLEELVLTMILVSIRVGSLVLFAPVFSSAALSPRIKAGFVFFIAMLVTPVLLQQNQAHEITMLAVLGEFSVGLIFGFSLSLINESVLFASQLLGFEFSFSLVNLIDPNSRIETPVLGQMLDFAGLLILISGGFDRTLLSVFLRSFQAVPPGKTGMTLESTKVLVASTGGILLAGIQLAAPVLAAGFLVEVVTGCIARVAPQLPVNILNIPTKTMVSYTVLIASLGVWPLWVERSFTRLLDMAQKLVQA